MELQQRRRTRVAAHKEATLAWPGGSRKARLENLSLKGCLLAGVAGDPLPAAGTGVELRIHLEPGDPELDLEVKGRVVRTVPAGLALEFTEIRAESFSRLFRLVQYNAEDPEGIEDELSSSAFGAPPPELN